MATVIAYCVTGRIGDKLEAKMDAVDHKLEDVGKQLSGRIGERLLEPSSA